MQTLVSFCNDHSAWRISKYGPLFALVPIFPYSDWIQSIFSPKKKKIRTRKNSLFEHFPRSVISPSTYSILDIYMGNTFECLIWQRCRQKPKIFSKVLSWFQEQLFSGLVHSVDFKASNIKNRNKSNLIIFSHLFMILIV